ncbi:peptide deformylase [Calidifontibacter terrae]
MSIQRIRRFGDEVLRRVAEPVVDFDRQVRELVADLTDTMMAAPGAGLAAPQIGVGLRVFTYYVDGEVGHLINPELDLSADEVIDDEGCLSIPEIIVPTSRARSVVARGFDMYGEAVTIEGSDRLARAIQHETDHLDGILFIDRLDVDQRELTLAQIRAADWFTDDVVVKDSPHPTRGLVL